MRKQYASGVLVLRLAAKILSVVTVVLLFRTTVGAEDPNGGDPLGAKILSPATILNADGTIATDRGLNGAVDLRGWDVTLDAQRGPVIEPQSEAGSWSVLPNQGLNNHVYALAVIGTDLYVGGNITKTADGTKTLNYIAKYNGSVWSSLANNGLNSTVNALAVSGTDLYVGGNFTQTADGTFTNLGGIARYSSGTEIWSPLNKQGLNGWVGALAMSGADLYVGGSFTQTGDGSVVNLNRIAKYSGGAWSSLAHNGLNSDVRALAANETELYVGGLFTQTADGSVALNYVAKYSGGAWSALAHNGLNSSVWTLALDGTDLCVGGWFTQTADASVALNYIAKYSGGAWSGLANNGLSYYVRAMAVIGTDRYVAGTFTQTADGGVTNLNRIAKYSGGAWSGLAHNGLNGSAYALAVSGTDLYVGGGFSKTADGIVTLNYVAKYSPAAACTLSCSATVPSSGQAGVPKQFTAGANTSGTGCGPISFYWEFGDGQTSTEQSPLHAYANAGKYDWKLTVSASGANPCTQSGSITISAGATCSITCSATVPSSGQAGVAVPFVGSAQLSAGCSQTITFEWKFGDGGTSSDQNPAHIYLNTGMYSWSLTASAPGATPCTSGGTINIVKPGSCVVSLTAKVPATGTVGKGVKFSGSGKASGNCTSRTVSYKWSFGDRKTSTAKRTTHTYTKAGTYKWSLTAKASKASATKTGTIRITGGGAACSLTVLATVPSSGVVNQPVSFSAKATKSGDCEQNTQYSWKFGDGGSSTDSAPKHTYKVIGIYHWELKVTNGSTVVNREGEIQINQSDQL